MATFVSFCPLATPANIATLRASVEAFRPRSAWSRGVAVYASMILDNFENFARFNASVGLPAPALDLSTALNGADDWQHFAAGGCGLVYNASIAANLLTPSELRAWETGRRSFDFIALEGRGDFSLFQCFYFVDYGRGVQVSNSLSGSAFSAVVREYLRRWC